MAAQRDFCRWPRNAAGADCRAARRVIAAPAQPSEQTPVAYSASGNQMWMWSEGSVPPQPLPQSRGALDSILQSWGSRVSRSEETTS